MSLLRAHPNVFRIALITTVFCSAPGLVNAQQPSREELLKEAGRIATQAERTVGDTYRAIQAGGDRRLIAEAERTKAAAFEKAIELWRTAGDEIRLVMAVEELTRLYSVRGDYDRVLNRLGVSFGCVALEDNKKTRVLYAVGGEAVTHGGVGPGSYWSPFGRLNGPLNQWTDEKMGCEGAAKMTLIGASFGDDTKWNAENVNWIAH